MELGLALPQFDYSVPGERPLRWSTVIDCARRAEALGFDSVWMADHLFFDLRRYGGESGRHESLDPLAALAAVALHTERIRVGTMALCAPLRPATVAADALATLDVVSGGRLTVGIGAGWYEPEFAAAGIAFESPGERVAALAEAIQVLRGMFTGGPFSFDGAHHRASEARCLPLPVQQPSPPIWVGGGGDVLLSVAARHGDGWNTGGRAVRDWYPERLAALKQACERVGRDPATVTRSLSLLALVGDDEADLARRYRRFQDLSPAGVAIDSLDEWRRQRMAGTVDQVAEQVAEWEALGVSTLILSVGPVPYSLTSTDDLEAVVSACRLGANGRNRST